jgi:hypothetical protein
LLLFYFNNDFNSIAFSNSCQVEGLADQKVQNKFHFPPYSCGEFENENWTFVCLLDKADPLKQMKLNKKSKNKTMNIAGSIQNVQNRKQRKKLHKIKKSIFTAVFISKKFSMFSKEFYKFLKVTTLLTKKNLYLMKQTGHDFTFALGLLSLCPKKDNRTF